jgi:hypothetical protein
MTKPVEVLISAGELLHGTNHKFWMPKIAADLAVSTTTVQQWANGRREFHLKGNIANRLVDLIDLRLIELHKLRLQLFDPGDTVATLASKKNLPPR